MTQDEERRIAEWATGLEARHLADLRETEVARALRALSSAYVERRGQLPHGVALDGAGKRAAFALYYGPLHFLLARHVAANLGLAPAAPGVIMDMGCGTGVVGAAVALACGAGFPVQGLDRHPWAVAEAQQTYRALGVDGRARVADVRRMDWKRRPAVVVAAYVLNELDREDRDRLLQELLAQAALGVTVLVVEPIATRVAPWVARWAPAFERAGGRHDEWRVQVVPPDIVRRLERAAGFGRDEVTARSLYLPGQPQAPEPRARPR
jgi:hypothetical protein